MRSSSDRFSYNSKSKLRKVRSTKKQQRKSDELAGGAPPSSGGHQSDESSEGSSKKGSGKRRKEKEKEKENGKKSKSKNKKAMSKGQQQQQHAPADGRPMLPSSWRGQKASQSDGNLARPDGASAAVPAPGHGTQIIISPRKPLVFPKSKQRLSFSGWLTHFNQQTNPTTDDGPKRKYKEGTVEGFLEDIQLDEHVNELVRVRGIATMERLFEVTVQQFYDMDIPTSDLRVLIEQINKRKNPPPPPPVEDEDKAAEAAEAEEGAEGEEEGDKAAAQDGSLSAAENGHVDTQLSTAADPTKEGKEDGKMRRRKRKGAANQSGENKSPRGRETEDWAAAVQALERRLEEETDRRAKAEREREEAVRALEEQKQRTGELERKLAEALALIQAMEQSAAAAATASTKKRAKAKKEKAKAKAKKEERKRTKEKNESEAKGKNDAVGGREASPEASNRNAAAAAAPPPSPPQAAAADGDREQKAAVSGEKQQPEESGESYESIVQYHYPLPIRVPASRVNRLSSRFTVKVKSPTASPRGGAGSEGRMRQAEKESFEQKQNDVRQWIEAATNETFPSTDFFQAIRSGVLLCKLLNVISPGLIKEVHMGDMAFYQMENLTYFVAGCRKLGVKTIFEPADLYHGKNLEAVLSCLDALDRWTRRNSPTYTGPYLARSTHSQFIRSLSGKLLLDRDAITKKDSTG